MAPRPLLSDVPHGLPTVVQTLNVVAPSAGLLKDDGRDENQNVAGFVAALQQQQQPQPQQLLQQTIDSHNNPAPSVTYALGGVDLAEVATSAPARFPSAAPRDYYARVAGDQQTVRVLAPSSIKTMSSAEPLADMATTTTGVTTLTPGVVKTRGLTTVVGSGVSSSDFIVSDSQQPLSQLYYYETASTTASRGPSTTGLARLLSAADVSSSSSSVAVVASSSSSSSPKIESAEKQFTVLKSALPLATGIVEAPQDGNVTSVSAPPYANRDLYLPAPVAAGE